MDAGAAANQGGVVAAQGRRAGFPLPPERGPGVAACTTVGPWSVTWDRFRHTD